jgi:hypothetical protein
LKHICKKEAFSREKASFLGFFCNLSGDMLRFQGKYQHFTAVGIDFLLNIGFIQSILVAQPAGQLQCLFMILDDMDPSENNDALDIQRPVTGSPVTGR